MNWGEIFKRTGFVLIVVLIMGLALWFSPQEKGFWGTWWAKFSLITIVLGINVISMVDRVFISYYFRHVRWVIFFCWLGALPMALYLYRVPFPDYLIFSFYVALLAYAGAFIFWIWHGRKLSHGEIPSYLTPEKVVEHLGKPTETVVSESGTMYLYTLKPYKKLKIFTIPGKVKSVEKIPPPLPDSIFGFSPEQIVNTLGWPKRIINLDSKVIYFYNDMKVIFINGQVADVQ
jgi:hypothetical protein